MNAIDEYITSVKKEHRAELERIRSIAHEMIPDAEETIYYKMPAIKYKNEAIIGFDSHKNHVGIYPFSGRILSKIKELDGFEQSAGALRETLDHLVPKDVLKKIISLKLEMIK